MKPRNIALMALFALLFLAGPTMALEESISLIPIEPSLFRHDGPTYKKYEYDVHRHGLVSMVGNWSATFAGGQNRDREGRAIQAARVETGPGFGEGRKALQYRWDLTQGWNTRTSLVLRPHAYSRIELAPGDGIFFRARSLGKELDNYPNRYVVELVLDDGQGKSLIFKTDYFEVEGIWGTYFIPLSRFADAQYRAFGIFAVKKAPWVVREVRFRPVTNKCRKSSLLLDTFAVYTTGKPAAGDRDGDGIPDPLDGDDDNDGVKDWAQKGGDELTFEQEGYVLYGGRWQARIRYKDRRLVHGDTLAVDVRLTIHSRSIARAIDAFPLFTAVLVGERSYDETGRYHQFSDHMISTLLTPSGLPVENVQPRIPTRHVRSPDGIPVSSPIDLMSRTLRKDIRVSGDTVTMSFAFRQLLDYAVPGGHYRLQLAIGVVDQHGLFNRFEELPAVLRSRQAGSRSGGETFREYFQPEESLVFVRKTYLPLIGVGKPATPRMPWALMMGVDAHGVRGIVPEEEKGEWNINFRTRLGGKPIYRRGRYNLEPGLPSLAYERLNVHQRMNWRAGRMRVTVTDPKGNTRDLGEAGFISPTRWGVSTRTGQFVYDFNQWGRYTVTMSGFLYDECGNVYKGGGTYVLWIARRITFGTFPSLPYEVGQVFHSAVEVVPPVPADVTVTLDHYPYSDPARKETWIAKNRSGPWGLFVAGKAGYRFKEPGEYFSHIEGVYTAQDGTLWIGSLYGACVVAPKNAVMKAHGRGYCMINGQVEKNDARFNLESEGKLDGNVEQYLFYPYHTGDVMYVASSMDFKNQVYPLMTMDFLPQCRKCGTAAYKRDPATNAIVCARCGHNGFHQFQPYPGLFAANAKQVPVHTTSRNGWSPHCFPEKVNRLAYLYTDGWRPGVSGRHLVGEGQMMNSYWPTSPSILGNQMHTGHNGDLPGDFYRFTGGIVYRDVDRGVNCYAIYSSMGVVIPKGSNANRVVAPCEEPLFNVCGRDHYLFLGGGVLPVPGFVLPQGARAPAAGAANPPVPAKLHTEVESPSGKVCSYDMQANGIGVFPRDPKNRTHLYEPGVWKARQLLSYKGKTGDVLGSGDGEYVFYVMPKDKKRVVPITTEQPFYFRIDPEGELRIDGSVPETVVEGTLYWTAISPGLILDEGSRKLVGGRFSYRFIPKEMSYCYPFFDYKNYMTGKPQLTDTVIFTLFLVGKGKDGKKLYGVRTITLRGERVINLPPLR